MKKFVLLMGACAMGLMAEADIYSNVYFWTRGLATVLNGNGVLEANEGRDSLGHTFNYTINNQAAVFTNE